MAESDHVASTAANFYAATFVGLMGLIAALEQQIGALDIRAAQDAVMVGILLLLALSLWPVVALTLARLKGGRTLRALGAPLYGVTVILLMLVRFDRPMTIDIPGRVAGLALAALAAWLLTELVLATSFASSLQRRLARGNGQLTSTRTSGTTSGNTLA
jgi:hypothetical protein